MPDEDGDGFAQFLTSGLSDEELDAIGPLPRRHGLLGAMLSDPKPYRTDDVTADSRFWGWPSAHPDMRSLLGVPIVAKGDVVGLFYLTNKEEAPASPGPPGGRRGAATSSRAATPPPSSRATIGTSLATSTSSSHKRRLGLICRKQGTASCFVWNFGSHACGSRRSTLLTRRSCLCRLPKRGRCDHRDERPARA